MNLNWNELLTSGSSSFFLVKTRPRDINIFSNDSEKNGVVSKLIRGENCTNSKELFKEFSSALQFPYYFGNNWNAFDECISDLYWIKSEKGYILFIINSESLLEKDLDIFLDTLKDASKFWRKKNKIFKVVFQTENKVNSKIEGAAEKRELPPFDETK